MSIVRPRTVELKRRLQELAARSAASGRTRRILIAEMGPPRWPQRVFRDPVLKPVDKIVWMVLRQSAIRGRFPSYSQVARATNVASKSTVARAVTILRATRWLARYAEKENGEVGRETSPTTNHGPGRVVYALHDAPLPVHDTLHLDAGYLNFVLFAQAHPHAQVRKVARNILASLDDGVEERAARVTSARR